MHCLSMRAELLGALDGSQNVLVCRKKAPGVPSPLLGSTMGPGAVPLPSSGICNQREGLQHLFVQVLTTSDNEPVCSLLISADLPAITCMLSLKRKSTE